MHAEEKSKSIYGLFSRIIEKESKPIYLFALCYVVRLFAAPIYIELNTRINYLQMLGNDEENEVINLNHSRWPQGKLFIYVCTVVDTAD